MTFELEARIVRAFIVLLALIPLHGLKAQTSNVTYAALFCSGSTADLASALPSGRQYTMVPRATTAVQGQVSITNSPTLNQDFPFVIHSRQQWLQFP